METRQHVWGGRRQVTLNDVAREAGVSQSAASVVLNGARSGTRVSAERRRAVLEAAERMGYRPNALARSLLTGRTHRVGVYSGDNRLDARNAFFSELLGGVLDGSEMNRQNMMIHSSGWGADALLDLISNRALDGLIVHAGENDPIIPLLGELRIPAVAVADRIESLPSVVVDEAASGELIARHLHSCGHRKILFKTFSRRLFSPSTRQDAVIRTAEVLGMQVIVRNETHGGNDGLDPTDVRLLTEGPDRATAVVAWNDTVAQDVCERLTKIGLAIPTDVAVTGFDGVWRGYRPYFELTTIRNPWAEVGRKAVEKLNALLEGLAVPAITTLPVEFVRGSTT